MTTNMTTLNAEQVDLRLSAVEAAFVMELLGDAIQYDVAGTPLDAHERGLAGAVATRIGGALGKPADAILAEARIGAATGRQRIVHSVEGALGWLVVLLVVLLALWLIGALVYVLAAAFFAKEIL